MITLISTFLTFYAVYIFVCSCGVCGEFHEHTVRHGDVGFVDGYKLIYKIVKDFWKDATEWGNFLCNIFIWFLKLPVYIFCYIIYTGFWIIRAIMIFLLKKR